MYHLFFWIPFSMRNFLTNFKNCSQPVRLVGEPDQLVHYVLFLGIAVRELGIVWVISHSFGVRIMYRLFFFGFLTL